MATDVTHRDLGLGLKPCCELELARGATQCATCGQRLVGFADPTPIASDVERADAAEVLPPIPSGAYLAAVFHRATFAELWREAENKLAVIILFILKLLRVNVPGSFFDVNVKDLSWFEVNRLPDAFDLEAGQLVTELERAGFLRGEAVRYEISDVANKSQWLLTAMPHGNGSAVAMVTHKAEGSQGRRRLKGVDFITPCVDGSWRWTSTFPQRLDAPPGMSRRTLGDAEVAVAWDAHRAEKSPTARSVTTAEAVRETLQRHQSAVIDNLIRRGIFRERTATELAQSALMESAATAATRPASAGVMVELERLQNARTSRVGVFLILLISVSVFFATGRDIAGGGATDAWERLGILMGVLFFHELGHFLAMKVLGYRDLKMFFIPMFGAAVTGKNYAAPGWKRVVVSLAGPVPGILVGAVMGVCALISPGTAPWVMKAASMLLLINATNLIPILPLDGGHVAGTLLFSRHWVLDVLFRIVAVLALGAAAAALGGGTMIGLTVVMALGIPLAIRRGRVKTALLKRGVEPKTVDGKVAPETAEAILAELRPEGAGSAKRSSRTNDRQMAQQVLSVFEAMSQRPPGWLATTGFLSVHVGAVLVAIVVGAVMLAASGSGGLAALARLENQRPRHSFTLSDVESHIAELPALPTTRPGNFGQVVYRQTVSATFDTDSAAKQAYREWESQVGPSESICRLGRVVVVSYPLEARKDTWIDRMESKTRRVVYVPGESTRMTLRLAAYFPTEAVAKEVEAAFPATTLDRDSSEKLLTPWSSQWHAAEASQRAGWMASRRTSLAFKSRQLQGIETALKAGPDAETAALRKQQDAANRRGDREKARAIGQALGKRRLEAEKAAREKNFAALIASAPTEGLDVPTLELLEKLSAQESELERDLLGDAEAVPNDGSDTADETSAAGPTTRQLEHYNLAIEAVTKRQRELTHALCERMGASKDAPGSWKFAVQSGVTQRSHREVVFSYLAFADTPQALSAMVDWLKEQGASKCHYDIDDGLGDVASP